ncbi:MAG: DNA/RNA non-specific endonuclease [Saprospirales bacterium]|nr:DNA/RNA non-specific endonuclease [Saprospirales bacterium]
METLPPQRIPTRLFRTYLKSALSHAEQRRTRAGGPGDRQSQEHPDYQNFSTVQHAQRRFPIYTAANIDGNLFRRLPREDNWQLEPRIQATHQWGPSLYSAKKSDFDKGHMTKREDAQWGHTDEEAKKGALSTFYYTNAVPQVAKLNQQLWRGLEDYILKSETVDRGLKINLFTGPVLSDTDPVFVSEVDGQQVRIPTLFWKVIYFTKSSGRLHRVGFLMGQEELLENMEIVHPRETSRDLLISEDDKLFMEFNKADIYQVNVSTIGKLTKLRFTAATEPFKDKRSVALIRKEVQGRGLLDEESSFLLKG